MLTINNIISACLLIVFLHPTALAADKTMPLESYIAARIAEFDKIPYERRLELGKIVAYGRSRIDSKEPVRFTFICTHNSRRSQMSQVWAAIAADHYGVGGIEAYSGGTESTAFNPRAVAALERAGVAIQPQGGTAQNPKYGVKAGSNLLTCFSKVYSDDPNPESNFAAVMTCSEADKKCPIVSGAAERIALPYEDPKASDSTGREASTYDERCAQIAREMLFVFSQLQPAGK